MHDHQADDRVIRFEGVSKQFSPAVHALSGIDLEVRRGEKVVLLGLSGSGKSTLLRHVDGLHRASTGTLNVLGQNLEQCSERSLRLLRRRIGFVFQQFHLVGQLSVLENVCSGALGRLVGPRLGLLSYSRKLRREALAHLDRVGLAQQAFQRADTLSGGQQQRAAVARALMQRPEILLADEPVASLDPDSAGVVMDLISTVAAEDGLTVLCSLHQVELALSWADRIVGLRDGQIVLESRTTGLNEKTAMGIYRQVGAAVTPATESVA